MVDITQWFLTNILSPLLLPLFLLATLCMLADVRPEPVLTGAVRIVADTISLIFSLVALLIKALTAPPRRRY